MVTTVSEPPGGFSIDNQRPTGATILVVEDDAAIADGLERELAAHGYGVLLARSGRSAIDHVAARVPDAVLLDLGLPDLDGVHVCRTLRRHAEFRMIFAAAAVNP